jgi:C-terminal processing protease CtpA/Prc
MGKQLLYSKQEEKEMKKTILMLVILYLSMSLFADVPVNDQQKLIDEYKFYSSWGNYDKAISSLEKYLEKDPSSFYKYQLGKLYIFSGKELDKAEQIFLNFIRDYDKLEDVEEIPVSSAYWRLGMVYEKMENLEKAEKSYKDGFNINEDSYCKNALDNLGKNTDFDKQLTKAEKLCHFFKIWHYANDFFAFFDQIELDWGKVKIEYLPTVQATKSNEEFYWLMTEMIALLKDGHTSAYVQGLWKPAFIQTKIIENNVYFINDDSYRKQTMLPGDKILKVNNFPVISAIEKTKKYISSSTEQWIKYRLESDQSFINFNFCDSIIVEYESKQNKEISKYVIYPSPNKSKKKLPLIETKLLNNNIGYIAVNSMHPTQDIIPIFNSSLDSLFNTNALIIDIRKNGGGSSNTGFHIISRVSNKNLPYFKSKVRFYSVDEFDKWFSEEEMFDIFYDVYQGIFPDTTETNQDFLRDEFRNSEYFKIESKPPIYEKPIVVLIGPNTFSAAEDFLASFHGTERITLVGKSTGGSTGQPLYLAFNNDFCVIICGRRCWCPDGYEFVGKGFMPDIEVEETIEDILSGKDVTLDKAILYLKGDK